MPPPMKVLLTGGAGFIGSHVGRQLLDAGHQVTIVDNLLRGHVDAVDPRARFVQADLADVETLTAALAGHDAVIHMAALIEVSESVSDPLLFAQNNIVNSVRLAEAMRSAGVKKIVFSSSATVYGVPKRLPILEDDPTIAFNPYGATKLAMEACLSAYHFSFGFDVILLRYFNPYGPGERHQPETHAVPNFIRAALEGRPIPLYWKGEQVRDFIYIDDLAAAHTQVLGLSGLQVFNVGTESGVKIIDVVRAIERILGRNLQIEDLGERAGDVPANYASYRKINRVVGWQPRVDLQEGLRRTIEYFSRQ